MKTVHLLRVLVVRGCCDGLLIFRIKIEYLIFSVSWYCSRFGVNNRWGLLLRKIVVLRRTPSSSHVLSRYSVKLPASPFLTSILASVNPFPYCTFMPNFATVAVVAAASLIADFVLLLLSVRCWVCYSLCLPVAVSVLVLHNDVFQSALRHSSL